MKSPILEDLKKLAPSVSFSVEHTHDPNFRWNGDGPDPEDEGFQAYDVDVYARAMDGETIEGRASLGGTYEKEGEFDSDIGGYLPQMLEEAARELMKQASGDAQKQLNDAIPFLKRIMRERWEKQQQECLEREERDVKAVLSTASEETREVFKK
jgi:hypothetical protein